MQELAPWLQLAAFVVALLSFYGALERRISDVRERVSRLEGKLDVLFKRMNDAET